MRNVVRAVIVEGDSLLTIKRIKENETYWVFPGGGVDDGENNIEALVRECKEEIGVDVEVQELMFEYPFTNKQFGDQIEYFYKCKVIGGEFGAGDGEEYSSNHNGTYEPTKIKLSELSNLDLRPSEVKNIISSI